MNLYTTTDHTEPIWYIEYPIDPNAIVAASRRETRRWVVAHLRSLMWSGIVVEAERVLREVQE